MHLITNCERYSWVLISPWGRSWEKQQEWLLRKRGGEDAWGLCVPPSKICLQHHTLEWILLTPTLYCCETAWSSALPPISFAMALSYWVKLFEAVRTKANTDESRFLCCFNLGNMLLKELVENYWKEWKHLYSFALENGRSTYLSFPGFYANVFWRGLRE